MPTQVISKFPALSFQKPNAGTIKLNSTHTLATGLVGFWPLLEGGGCVTRDYSGYANDGKSSNNAAWAQGLSGSALSFNNDASAVVDLGNPTALQLTGSVSMSCWVYTNWTNPNGIYGRPLSKLQWVSNVFNGYEMVHAANDTGSGIVHNSCYIQIAKAGVLFGQSDTIAIPLGRWVHYVGVYNGVSGDLRLYRDGVSRSNQNAGASKMGASTNDLYIGNLPGTVSQFHGMVDLPAVWNRALSAAEVRTLFNDPYVLLRRYPSATRLLILPETTIGQTCQTTWNVAINHASSSRAGVWNTHGPSVLTPVTSSPSGSVVSCVMSPVLPPWEWAAWDSRF